MTLSCTRAMKLTSLIWCCCFQCVITDILICSDFLVSGSYGVNDTALSASSVLVHSSDGGPRNARLFYPGDDFSTPKRLAGWQSDVAAQDQFIQVTFPADTIIHAVTIQGRHKDWDKWVKTYYLLYSMDGSTWTTITSSVGSPKLFVGNFDKDTPVTAEVTPKVTARHLRINPRSWNGDIVLRFDVSGCQTRTPNDGSYNFARKSVILTEELVGSQSVITTISPVPSLKDCALNCYRHDTCLSYTYQTVDGIQRCTCYKTWIVKPGCYSSPIGVFVNQDILDLYGYKEDPGTAMLYNIIEVRKNQTEASAYCTRLYTQLMKIDTTSKMTSLNNTISSYSVLKRDYRFYVSGEYISQAWRYSGGTDIINSVLWSPSNPDTSEGHCVMLTLTGLTSVDCQLNLYSICGI